MNILSSYWKIILLFFGIGFLLLVFTATFVFDAVNIIKDTKSQVIVEVNGQSLLAWVVSDPVDTSRGLSGFQSLGINQGMLFDFSDEQIRGFWMKDMNFPIDIIWIRNDVVVGVDSNIPTEPGVPDHELTIYMSPEPVDKVLETRSGRSYLLGLSVGDTVSIRPLVPGALSP